MIHLSINPVQQHYLQQIERMEKEQTDDLPDTLNLISALRKGANELERQLRERWAGTFDEQQINEQLQCAMNDWDKDAKWTIPQAEEI